MMDDEGPLYSESAPCESLADHVACIWHFRSAEEKNPQPIVPDGRPELIIHLANPYRELPSGDVQPMCLLAGQLTRPLMLAPDGPVDVIGVRFHPDGAFDFVGGAMDEFTDRRQSLLTSQGEEDALLKLLKSAAGRTEQIALVEKFVGRRIAGQRPDPLVRDVVNCIMSQDEWTIPEGLSQRQFQRRFRQRVGISARMLMSVRRFRAVFDRIEDEAEKAWCRRALAAGYFDQPQMARDFRRFLGMTARQWLTQPTGLATALSDTPA